MEYPWHIPTIYLVGVPDVALNATFSESTESGFHLESCTPGQDLANWYVPVRTGTYTYMMVHNSTRFLHLYEAVRTGTYQYIL
jgi:hypothetical protein